MFTSAGHFARYLAFALRRIFVTCSPFIITIRSPYLAEIRLFPWERIEAADGRFPTVATGKTCHALRREPPLVMHRCGRSLLSKPTTKLCRSYSSTATLAAVESATSLPRPNALTLIHKSSALLPSILSPTPKRPVESLELWTHLLDYAHHASIIHKDSMSNENRKARIVGTFILVL